jgi:hypothetical protein
MIAQLRCEEVAREQAVERDAVDDATVGAERLVEELRVVDDQASLRVGEPARRTPGAPGRRARLGTTAGGRPDAARPTRTGPHLGRPSVGLDDERDGPVAREPAGERVQQHERCDVGTVLLTADRTPPPPRRLGPGPRTGRHARCTRGRSAENRREELLAARAHRACGARAREQRLERVAVDLARTRSAVVTPTATSRRRVISARLRSTAARCSRSIAGTFLPGTSSMRAYTSSMPSKSVRSFAAVFAPTPGTPGRLSDPSPRSAASCT